VPSKWRQFESEEFVGYEVISHNYF